MAFQKYSRMDQSLFTRFVRLGVPYIELNQQGRARPTIAELYNWRYRSLGDMEHVKQRTEFRCGNGGFAFDYQMVDVSEADGGVESEPTPHFFQNLAEAEYIISVYTYMRLLGYPANKITILSTYNGQVKLLEDVAQTHCAWTPQIGMPGRIATVDKYQGQQNDFVLLSLVRSKTVGHLRDVRRLVVACSRARLGLYIFGRKDLFSNCIELGPTFDRLNKRPSRLQLVLGENYKCNRKVGDVSKPFEVLSKDHMQAIVKQRLEEEKLIQVTQERVMAKVNMGQVRLHVLKVYVLLV
jgi:intron-binding protein aquarius